MAISALLQRNERRIVLKLPLPSQKLVIAAAGPVGVLATDARTRLVNGAAAGLNVEEGADAAVDFVLLMPEDRAVIGGLGEAFGRRFRVDTEVLGKTVDIPFVDVDFVVPAAVRRALTAVVTRSHHRIVTAWTTPSRSYKLICS